MERPEDRQASLAEAKARFLEEAGSLTPSAWIRGHPDAAIGAALAAGFLMGCSPESQEATVRSASEGLRMARAFLSRFENPPGGRGRRNA